MRLFKIIGQAKALSSLLGTNKQATGLGAGQGSNTSGKAAVIPDTETTIVDAFRVRSHGLAQRGIPDGVAGKLPTITTGEITADHTSVAATIQNSILAETQSIEAKLKSVEDEISQPKPIDYYRDKVEQERQAAQNGAEKRHLTVSLLNAEEVRLKEKLAGAQGRYLEILNRHGGVPPLKKPIVDTLWQSRSIIGLLIVTEAVFNLASFQKIGLGENLGALVAAMIFAFAQAFFADRAGTNLHDSPNALATRFYVGFTMAICIGISAIRLQMDGNILQNLFIYAFANCIVAFVTGWVAYAHAPYREYHISLVNRDKASKELEAVNLKIEQMEKGHQHECGMIDIQAKKQADGMAERETDRLKHERAGHEATLRGLKDREARHLQELEDIKQKAVAEYHRLYLSAHPENGHSNGIAKTVLPILLLASLSIFGCSSPPLPPTYLTVMVDRTDTAQALDIDQMADYIMGFVPCDTVAWQWGKATITLSQIGETSAGFSQTIEMAASEPDWFKRNELYLKKRPKLLREELRQALRLVATPGTGMKQSYIHRTLYYRLGGLDTVQGNRIVLCWSDLIANDLKVNLYKYRENPLEILEKQDSLIAAMTEGYPLPKLEGVRLINIYQPSKLNDELHESAKKLFYRYWHDSLGMDVEFKTNLPMQFLPISHADIAKQ